MACFTEWGGMNEIQAMSLLYEREFIIFNGQKQMHQSVTNNGFKDAIYLCYIPQKQYETIYTRDFVATAAYCQCRNFIAVIHFRAVAIFSSSNFILQIYLQLLFIGCCTRMSFK